jgi:hypothetical protein
MFSSRHIKTTLALTLAIGAVAVPAASARFDLNPPPASQTARASSPVSPNPDQQTIATPMVSSPPAQVVKISQPNGFGWGDAGIGAGAMLGLILVLIGSTLYVTHRRTAHVS